MRSSDSYHLRRNKIRRAHIGPRELDRPRGSGCQAESALQTRCSSRSARAFAKIQNARPFPNNCTGCCRSATQTNSRLRIFRGCCRRRSRLRVGWVERPALALRFPCRPTEAINKPASSSWISRSLGIPSSTMACCLGRYPLQVRLRTSEPRHFLYVYVTNLIRLAGVVVRGANEKVRSLYSEGIRTQ